MMRMMQGLEPRKYQKGDLILFDLEEVDEIIFVCSGNVNSFLIFSNYDKL